MGFRDHCCQARQRRQRPTIGLRPVPMTIGAMATTRASTAAVVQVVQPRLEAPATMNSSKCIKYFWAAISLPMSAETTKKGGVQAKAVDYARGAVAKPLDGHCKLSALTARTHLLGKLRDAVHCPDDCFGHR